MRTLSANAAALWEASERLKGIELTNQSWEKLIDECDRPGAFFYIDPPYLQQTRPQSGASYGHEFGDAAQVALLKRLREIKGRAAVSGYRSKLYD